MQAFGAIPDRKDKRDFKYAQVMKSIQTPDVVDYEAEMSPVKSQGVKGACVAFALCAIREWKEQKDRGGTGLWQDMSEDYLYAQVQVHPGGGSYPREALKVLHKNGVCPEQFYPYERGNDKKRMLWTPSLRARNSARRFKIDRYVRLRNAEEVMQSLTVNGPLFFAGEWLSQWTNTRRKHDGYPVFGAEQGTVRGYHAYAVAGFDASNELFKCKNSWSTNFGNSGYFYLSFDALQHVIDMWAIIDKKHPLSL